MVFAGVSIDKFAINNIALSGTETYRAGSAPAWAWSWFLATALGLVLTLSGCAGVRTVDNEVNTFAVPGALTAAAPGVVRTYRFDRLPSQQSLGERQNQLETMVQSALAPFQFLRLAGDESKASYSVQIGARTQRLNNPQWDGPRFGLRDYAVTASGQLVDVGPFVRAESPYFVREVSLLVREGQGGRVVYETHARHEGPWADSDTVLPAMFTAALQGFPNAPSADSRQKPRRVTVQLPP